MGMGIVRYLVSILVLRESVSSLRLNDFVSHFEHLTFDRDRIHGDHGRVKRSIQPWSDQTEPMIRFRFEAHGLVFNVKLQRDMTVFGDYFELDIANNDTLSFVQNFLFEGVLEDVPGSYVYGSLRNGVFDGRIVTPNETFYIENSRKFDLENTSTHAVIYKESDIDLGAISRQNGAKTAHCGISNDIYSWMYKIQNSQIPTEQHGTDERKFAPSGEFLQSHPHHSSKQQHGFDSTFSLPREFLHRAKRHSHAFSQGKKVLPRTTCRLHIQTDPMLWRYIAKQVGMDAALISEEIFSIIGQHVNAANEIFANSIFQGDKTSHKNIQLVVQRVKIETDDSCSPNYTGPHNPYCQEDLDAPNLLDLHSQFNHDDFCLSYAFTFRNFSGGVVGLAWVASPDNTGAAGGVCGKFQPFPGDSFKRSLNIGILTFLSYNHRLPPRISHLAFTHELGHSFGSPHDPKGAECQPGGKHGNFLMYESENDGHLRNNDRFSKCSLKHIGKVLDTILANHSSERNCFEPHKSPYCGNQIVEDGEECDCGYDRAECTDKCCIPRTQYPGIYFSPNLVVATSTTPHINPRMCKRTTGSECSPSEGPCCETDCTFSLRSQHQLKPCQTETECTEPMFCSGSSPHCPTPRPKPNNATLCNNGTQVCIDGECRGSLCMKYGYDECYLQHEQHPNKSTLCELACLNTESKCVPISNVTSLNKTLKLPPGTPCDNFRGFCDASHQCSSTNIAIMDWIKENIWWTGLFLFAFLLFVGLFVTCCVIHKSSHSPHLKFWETLIRPIRMLQHRRVSNIAAQPHLTVAFEKVSTQGRQNEGQRPLPSDEPSTGIPSQGPLTTKVFI